MNHLDTFFAGSPYVTASAPGRVNLMGEHTDYNEGFMLPVATPQRTWVRAAYSDDQRFHFYSLNLKQSDVFTADGAATTAFGRYLEGCIRLLEQQGVTILPLRLHVQSNLAIGAGLSSSAALEVATLRALRRLLDLPLDDVALALLAQQAEIQYAGVHCGIMDQMAASLADSDHMLYIDARTLETDLLPIPAEAELMVIDSGIPRSLATSKYNERRSECDTAAKMLGVVALRDVTDTTGLERLAEPYRRRARHVVTENQRVLVARRGVPATEFGALMNASHRSLRDDYQVSIDALDDLTVALRAHEGVYGARLTGAGFGGACVALCRPGMAQTIGASVLAAYAATGRQGSLLMPPAVAPSPAPSFGITP